MNRNYALALAIALALALNLVATGTAFGWTIEKIPETESANWPQTLETRATGRAVTNAETGEWLRQWPGTYFETAFSGDRVAFRIGAGDVILDVRVDDDAPVILGKPEPGLYQLTGLAPGDHRLRVDVASENQGWTTIFGGFFAGEGTRALPLPAREVQLEFIGDSHTVGYANRSWQRECDNDEVWATTATSRGIAPLAAAAFDADYQVNAISGRGVVRNYGGGDGDTLPQAYPYTLFDKTRAYTDATWSPAVIVIALGTNDFSTPLTDGEPWQDRAALREAYADRYMRFVLDLRERHPDAGFVLWIADRPEGEISTALQHVVDKLAVRGERRVEMVIVSDLEMTACHWHPGQADNQRVATALNGAIARQLAAAGSGNEDSKAAQLQQRLANNPATPWNVYGPGQVTEVLPGEGPQGFPAFRVDVQSKAANPWEIGTVNSIEKPIAKDDVIVVALWLRAPHLADGETTEIPSFGLSLSSPPYDGIAGNSATVTHQWQQFFATGTAGKNFSASELGLGVHLGNAARVIDLGPVRVFNLGPGADVSGLVGD
ncbi:hypothetical protein F3N42_08495 [Marinihelvus fidelis]|uniref:Carbohydrate esterase 2 N-terminal domain-containing protein n=1 Tax=Marinihelvus fidelis TaxID=2613842 RepID=A0A5N0T8U1_9GAMM|nr:hypothetical protein [Marinihelvus fidelis]KAA9131352.1 hypothetical protein F3N42_08495 [Marinihelvus fidelis]